MKKNDIFIVMTALAILLMCFNHYGTFVVWATINVTLSLLWLLQYMILVRRPGIKKSYLITHMIIFIICVIPFILMSFFIIIWKANGFGH